MGNKTHGNIAQMVVITASQKKVMVLVPTSMFMPVNIYYELLNVEQFNCVNSLQLDV